MANSLLEEIEPAPSQEFGFIRETEPPRKTFFYRRISSKSQFEQMTEGLEQEDPDKDIFSCYEDEAAELHKKPNEFKQVGVSDGTSYLKSLVEELKKGGYKRNQPIPILEVRRIMKGAFKAELEAARGKFQVPRRHDRYWGGGGDEQARRDFLGHG